MKPIKIFAPAMLGAAALVLSACGGPAATPSGSAAPGGSSAAPTGGASTPAETPAATEMTTKKPFQCQISITLASG